jgi:ABC-type multidrug transport system fused ATPase/permease subunit
VPVTAIVTTYYGGRMISTWHALYGSAANSNARIEENVGGSRVVQAFEEFAHPHPRRCDLGARDANRTGDSAVARRGLQGPLDALAMVRSRWAMTSVADRILTIDDGCLVES